MRKKAINTTIKEQLISAAWELFLEKGYDATTVNEIIERSPTIVASYPFSKNNSQAARQQLLMKL